MKFCLNNSLLNMKLKSSAPGGNPDLHGVMAAINHLKYSTAVDYCTRRMDYKLFSKERNTRYFNSRSNFIRLSFLLAGERKFVVSKKSEI